MAEFDDWMACINLQSMGWSEAATKFETRGMRFLRLICDLAQHSSRTYYGNYPLDDAHHNAKLKCDGFISQKLSDEEHQIAINPLADVTKRVVHSWRDVLVPREFKYNSREDCSQRTVTQLAGYVREVFGAQPGRMFVHAFTVCGSIVRFWFFDRACVSISKAYNIQEESNKFLLVRAFLGYTMMSAVQLGFNDRYKDAS